MSEKQKDWLLDWSRKGLDDAEIEASCQKELSKRKEHSGKCANLEYQEVDLSGNSISWKSCDAIVDLCSACQDLRVLKLSKNRLCDRATPALCRLLRQCNSIEQVHLSRNKLTDSGASSLVAAAQDGRLSDSNAVTGKRFPIWMRLEQNCINQPDSLLEELRSRPSKASSSSSSCGACSAEDAAKCGPRNCDRAALVHLPYFSRQSKETTSAASVELAMAVASVSAEGTHGTQEKARSSSRTRSPELEAPTASAGTPTVADETDSPTSGSGSPGLVIVPPPPKSAPKTAPQDTESRREPEKQAKIEKDKEKDRDKEKEKDRTKEKDKDRTQDKDKDRTQDHRGSRQGGADGGARAARAGAADLDRDREKRRRRDGTDDGKEKNKDRDAKDKAVDPARSRRRRRSGSATSNNSEARKQLRRQQLDVPVDKERRAAERAKRGEKDRHKDREKDKEKATEKDRRDRRDDREHRKREKEPSPRQKDSSAKGRKEDKGQKDVKDSKDTKEAKDKADDSKKSRLSKWGPTPEETKELQLKEAAAQAAAAAKLAEEAKVALDKAKAEAAAAEAKKAEELAARKEKAAAARRAAPPPPWMAAQAVFKATPSSGSAETPSASSTSTATEGAKKRKLDLKDIGDLQRALTEERNKMRLFIIKAKSDFEDRKEKGGAAKDSGSTGEQEYYNAKIGEEFGPDNRFRVEALIGRGVFSSVYHCTDTKDGNTALAIKFIRSNTMMRKAAEKEVEMYRRLERDGAKEDAEGARHCINLASVGTFEHCGHLGVVFELLKCDMRYALQRYGQGAGLPLPSVSQYVRQLLLALRTLRIVGVIHADLKPDNILMTLNKAEIQICDFGSAADASEEQSMRTAYAQPRYYRAPEIILGVQYDTQIDVWSTGATTFELATGRILFTGKTNNQMLKQMLDVCGGFPKRMATEGEFSKKHFNSDGDFVSRDPDSITGQPDVMKAGPTTKPARSMLSLLQAILTTPAPNVSQSAHEKHVEQLAELVQGCLCIDTLERLDPSKALELPFFRKDR